PNWTMSPLPNTRVQHPEALTTLPIAETATILVVDDDPGVRTVVEMLLTRSGYRVLVAAGGREGVSLFQQHHDVVGLVRLDILMPDLDGPATLAELHRINPGLVCCLMSGQLGDYTEEDLRALGAQAFLAKPFRPDNLLHTIARLLPDRVAT